MSDPAVPPQGQSTSKQDSGSKPRNPVERMVVWGLILAMVALVGWEATKRFGYSSTLNRIQASLADEESGGEWKPLNLTDVEAMVSGFPSRTEEETRGSQGIVVFRWQGLLKDHGGIHVHYDKDDKLVISCETDSPPIPEEYTREGEMIAEDPPFVPEGQEGGGGRPPRGARGQGGPGGPPPVREDLRQHDADGDGKLTIQEVPDYVKEQFAGLDGNGDGFLEGDEIPNPSGRRRGARGDSEDPGDTEPGGDGRPQRPDFDSGEAGDSTSAAADESPAASDGDDSREGSDTP